MRKNQTSSKPPMDQVVFEDNRVVLNTLYGGPGGQAEFQGETSVEKFSSEWCRRCHAVASIPFGLVPPGVVLRGVFHERSTVVFLMEVSPGPRTMQWLKDDSPEPFGLLATYRDVYIALPWQYFFIAMDAGGALSRGSSVYFLNRQMRNEKEVLCDPHFFNCSVDAYGYHCWVCSQYFPGRFARESLVEYAARVVQIFYTGGFNQSSEYHEGASFWERNRKKISDRRVRSLPAWEKETRERPEFALEVPWISSGLTVRNVVDQLVVGSEWSPRSATDVANVVTSCI